MNEKHVYEVRRNGETVCVSSVPQCGESLKKLRQIVADGHQYYVDGKYQRKPE